MKRADLESIAGKLFHDLKDRLGLPRDITRELIEGRPILVSNMNGEPSYWLVPAAIGDRAAGFLRLDLDGELMSFGKFGQGADINALPPLSFLTREKADGEIERNFGGSYRGITPAVLVHDGPKERIAWVSRGISTSGAMTLLFWSFGTPYSRLMEIR